MTQKSGFRKTSIKLKTARGRTNASARWLQRHLNDPYVQRARAEGWRSRAAFKLLEIQQKYKLLKQGQTLVDLGAAPGGWSQVIASEIKLGKNPNSNLIALDLLEWESLPDVTFIQGDFTDEETLLKLQSSCPTGIDGVLSDMAPNNTGHKQTDHLRIVALLEEALLFAQETLKKGGFFVAKSLQGGGQNEIVQTLKKSFEKVSHFKPPASRKESPEVYVVAQLFKKT